MQKKTILTLIAFCIAIFAHAQHREPPQPPRPPNPFQRGVLIRERYKPVGRPNVLTGNVNVFLIHDCLSGSIGLGYERFLDANGLLSADLSGNVYAGSTFTISGYRTGQAVSRINGLFIKPALLFHPLGNKRRVDFSFGPSCMYGSTHLNEHEAGNPSYRNPEKNFDRIDNLVAILMDVNMTVHTTNAFVFATQLCVGSLLDAGPVQGSVVQFGIKLGGRF